MRKSILILGFICILFSCENKENHYLAELEEKEIEIDDLKKKILELEEEIEENDSTELKDSKYEDNLNSIDEEKRALIEQELNFYKNKTLEIEVFFGMIKNSEYKDYIESYSYKNYQNPLLSKVNLKIEGTDNIIEFYSDLYSEYHWLYMETNIKQNPR